MLLNISIRVLFMTWSTVLIKGSDSSVNFILLALLSFVQVCLEINFFPLIDLESLLMKAVQYQSLSLTVFEIAQVVVDLYYAM